MQFQNPVSKNPERRKKRGKKAKLLSFRMTCVNWGGGGDKLKKAALNWLALNSSQSLIILPPLSQCWLRLQWMSESGSQMCFFPGFSNPGLEILGKHLTNCKPSSTLTLLKTVFPSALSSQMLLLFLQLSHFLFCFSLVGFWIFIVLFCFFVDRISLYSPGYPQTHRSD